LIKEVFPLILIIRDSLIKKESSNLKIQQLLKYFKQDIEVLNKKETSSHNDTVEIRLKKRKVICKHCKTTMRFHWLGRKRRVLAGEGFRITCKLYPET